MSLYHAKAAGTNAGPKDWPESGYTYPGPPWPAGWEHEIPSSVALAAFDRSARTTGFRFESGPIDGTGAPTRLAAYETAIDDGESEPIPGGSGAGAYLTWTWIYSDVATPGWNCDIRRTVFGFDTSAVPSPSSARLKIELDASDAIADPDGASGSETHDAGLGATEKLYIFDAEGCWNGATAKWDIWNATLVPLLATHKLAEITINDLRNGDQYINLSAVPTERSGRRWLLFVLNSGMGLTLSPDTYPTLPTYVDASGQPDAYANPVSWVAYNNVKLEVTP